MSKLATAVAVAPITLQPGQSKSVLVTARIRAGAAGGETQVEFKASPVSHGSVHVAAGVATTIKVGNVQEVAFHPQHYKATAAAQSHAGHARDGSLSIGPVSGAAGMAVVIVAAAVLMAVVVLGVRMLGRKSRGAHRG